MTSPHTTSLAHRPGPLPIIRSLPLLILSPDFHQSSPKTVPPPVQGAFGVRELLASLLPPPPAFTVYRLPATRSFRAAGCNPSGGQSHNRTPNHPMLRWSFAMTTETIHPAKVLSGPPRAHSLPGDKSIPQLRHPTPLPMAPVNSAISPAAPRPDCHSTLVCMKAPRRRSRSRRHHPSKITGRCLRGLKFIWPLTRRGNCSGTTPPPAFPPAVLSDRNSPPHSPHPNFRGFLRSKTPE